MNHPATVDTAVRDSAAPRARVLAVHPGAEMFGSDRMFLESVIGLSESLHVVVSLPNDGELADALGQRGIDVVIAPTLVLRRAMMGPRGWPGLVRDLIRGARSASQLITRLRPDFLYVSTVTLPIWPIIGRLHRVRVVTHIHEAESTANVLIQRMIHLPHAAAHLVIANSAFTERTLQRALPRRASRVEIVLNGLEGPTVSTPLPAQPGKPLRLLYVGRLSPRKGPDLAIDALRILLDAGVDARLDLLGDVFDGYEWFERRLRCRVAEHHLEDRVSFLGFEQDVWPRLTSADIILVPSVGDESFGNTAVEAILAERPVVVSDSGGLREAASGYSSAILVRPGDAGAIACAIQDAVYRWPELRHATALSARSARGRHAPDRYRRSIAAAVTGTTTVCQPGLLGRVDQEAEAERGHESHPSGRARRMGLASLRRWAGRSWERDFPELAPSG